MNGLSGFCWNIMQANSRCGWRPQQVKFLPISDKFLDYAQTILESLKNADIRAEIDDRSEKIGKKIRDTELARVPYMLIIGEKEMNENKVSVEGRVKVIQVCRI